ATILFLCVWYLFDLMLLAFAGALLAIILHACAKWVEKHTPGNIGPKLSYTATILGIVILVCFMGYWIVPRAINEGSQIVRIMPKSLAQVAAYLSRRDWGRYVVRDAHRLISASSAGAQISTMSTDIGQALEGAIVIVVVGLYGALNARGYAKSLLSLFPEKRRPNVAKNSEAVIYTLRWWLIGQLVPMFALGISTMIGLWLLGVPLAFALGLLTGVMIFIPYVGSWLVFIPAVLVSLTRGVDTAIYVTVLYLVIHAVEGYLLTPLVQKRAVLLPPVLTILAQLFMWKVAGLLGVALATPIAAASLVLVKRLYLHKDVA
ncbi:MAG: AI-2E family transporter, partial [Candidatus Micrarchaeaceae archaeon]